MKQCFQKFFQVMIIWRKSLELLLHGRSLAAASSFVIMIQFEQYNPTSSKVNWSVVVFCFNINIKLGMYPQTEALDYRVNICVTVCLWIARSELMLFFPLTPENFINRKVLQVSKGADERNVGLSRVIGLGKKDLLSSYRNQLKWTQRNGVNLYLFLIFS